MMKMICRGRSLSALKMAGEPADDDWEIIDPSDDEDTFSFDESISEDDVVVDDHCEPIADLEDLECKQLDSVGSPSPELEIAEVVAVQTVVVVPVQYAEDDEDVEEDVEEEEEEEEEEEDEDDYLDDELVPRWVNDRLVRQRMSKFGKKALAKVKYAKKPAYHSSRPGTVQGKHGLGLRHRIY